MRPNHSRRNRMDCFGYLSLLYSGQMARSRGCMSSSQISMRERTWKKNDFPESARHCRTPGEPQPPPAWAADLTSQNTFHYLKHDRRFPKSSNDFRCRFPKLISSIKIPEVGVKRSLPGTSRNRLGPSLPNSDARQHAIPPQHSSALNSPAKPPIVPPHSS